MSPDVNVSRIEDFTDAERAALQELSRAVYPPEELDDWAGRHMEWATAEWGVCVTDESGALASYAGVVTRQGLLNEREVRIGGVGGVKTHPESRNRGHAARGLRKAIEFFHEQPDIEFALLVCEPRLIEYYSRLGWREFSGRLLTCQFGETVEFTFNQVMVIGIGSSAPQEGTIDLPGPPW